MRATSGDTEPSAPGPQLATDQSIGAMGNLRARELGRTAAELKRQSDSRSSTRPRRLGPYTAADAERDLMAADDRDDVLTAFFDFASQYFEYCALFVIHTDLAEGYDARGPGASSEDVRKIGVPLELPSAVAEAHQAQQWQLTRLSGGGLNGGLAKDLRRPAGPQVLLLPIVMRKRCVLIMYGDHGREDVQLSAIGDVISFAPLVATSFENLILRRKRSAQLPRASIPPGALAGRRHPRPSREQRAQALAGVLEPNEDTSAPAVPVSAAPPAPVAAEPARPDPVQPPAVGEPPAEPPTFPPAELVEDTPSPVPASRNLVPMQVLSIEPPKAAGPSDRPSDPAPPFPLTRRSSVSGAGPLSEPPEDGWDIESRRAQSARQSVTNPTAPDSWSPDIDVNTAEVDQDVEDALIREEQAPLAPASRSMSHSARPLGKPGQADELKLPSVIVDSATDCGLLVEKLCAGDSTAAHALLDYGAAAITSLVAAFPGPITAELRRGSEGPGRASDCGPILRALARIGTEAAPFVTVRTADANPEVRAWATRLLGELPTVDGAVAIAKRLVDADANVRRSALAAARMLQHHPAPRDALRKHVTTLALDSGLGSDQRHAAIEALTDIRDPRAVPAFIGLLEDNDRELAKSAHWGLAVLTRTDLGTDVVSWNQWWNTNRERHRVEWLIEALMHDNADIRRAAGDELKSVTKEYFGYYDDLPKKERAAAQQRYRSWWETRGKQLFH